MKKKLVIIESVLLIMALYFNPVYSQIGSGEDNRTSDICNRLNEKEVKAGENFEDSISGFSGPAPPAHVNCRSRLRFKPDED